MGHKAKATMKVPMTVLQSVEQGNSMFRKAKCKL